MNELSRYLTGLCIFISVLFMSSDRCLGYVLPSDQLLSYMVKNLSEFRTLVITQTTWQKDERGEEEWKFYQERIWMESPNLFHSQILNLPKEWLMKPDTSFRSLLMAESDTWVKEILTHMGINLHAVGLTRVEKTVAYRIGGKDPYAPKIVIEKERFLPLVLTYALPEYYDIATITVLFSDYRKVENGWYPFEITYYDPRGFRENCVIDTLQANVPIDPAVFTGAVTSHGTDQALEQDEMIQNEKDSKTLSVPTID